MNNFEITLTVISAILLIINIILFTKYLNSKTIFNQNLKEQKWIKDNIHEKYQKTHSKFSKLKSNPFKYISFLHPVTRKKVNNVKITKRIHRGSMQFTPTIRRKENGVWKDIVVNCEIDI